MNPANLTTHLKEIVNVKRTLHGSLHHSECLALYLGLVL